MTLKDLRKEIERLQEYWKDKENSKEIRIEILSKLDGIKLVVETFNKIIGEYPEEIFEVKEHIEWNKILELLK